MVRYCAVYGCLESTRSNKQRRFFCFPSVEQRCKHWMKAIGRKDLESKDAPTLHGSYFVCDLHFADSDCNKKKLKTNAVPTLLLPQMEDPSGKTKYTQTDIELICNSCTIPIKRCDLQIPSSSQSSQLEKTQKRLDDRYIDNIWGGVWGECPSEYTHRKRKLGLGLKSKGKKRRLLESLGDSVTDAKKAELPALLKKIIDAQKSLTRNSQGNKYDHEFIMVALNIYFAAPAAYRFLSETLGLLNTKTLQSRVALGISTKFDKNVLKCLEYKIRNFSESEKYCIVCADEVSLKHNLYYQINKDKIIGFHEINGNQTKEIATRALVVMARGILSNWKQPLAFCFLSKTVNYVELNTWLENIIANIIEIGFNVCAFTSDQSLSFMNMAINKPLSADQPFFFVNGKKIYYIFDVPHLIKSLRNNLIYNDFIYRDADESEQVASWDDIERMYDIEKNKKYKVASKLTESHIRPNSLEKLCVKYATQVLSRTVAVTIYTLVETGKLPGKSMGTTNFLDSVNDTFDILNSSTVSNDNKYKKAFCQETYQIHALEKFQHILSELRVINRQNGKEVTNKVKFIKGFLISIEAISNLAADLKAAGCNHLFTRRLNLEVLENFGTPRGSNYCQLSAIQLHTAFKNIFTANIFKHSLQYTNCVQDLDKLLTSLEEAQSSLQSKEYLSKELSDIGLKVGSHGYRFNLPKENVFTYVCGYLFKMCHDCHKDCEIMKDYAKRNEQVDGNNPLTYPFGALIKPPEEFIQYIKQINTICEDHFVNGDFYYVGNELMTKISDIEYDLPCCCFPLEFLKKLFVRFRIYNVIRHNNKNFRKKTFRNKYFSIFHL